MSRHSEMEAALRKWWIVRTVEQGAAWNERMRGRSAEAFKEDLWAEALSPEAMFREIVEGPRALLAVAAGLPVPPPTVVPDWAAGLVEDLEPVAVVVTSQPLEPLEDHRGPLGHHPEFRAALALMDPREIARNLPGVSYPRAPWEVSHG